MVLSTAPAQSIPIFWRKPASTIVNTALVRGLTYPKQKAGVWSGRFSRIPGASARAACQHTLLQMRGFSLARDFPNYFEDAGPCGRYTSMSWAGFLLIVSTLYARKLYFRMVQAYQVFQKARHTEQGGSIEETACSEFHGCGSKPSSFLITPLSFGPCKTGLGHQGFEAHTHLSMFFLHLFYRLFASNKWALWGPLGWS